LEDSAWIDFRLAAQRAGHTDVDAMPADLRRAIAETAAHEHMAEIITELQLHHPEWTPEELTAEAELRANDIAALFAMGADERDAYAADTLAYQELAEPLDEMQAELDTLREQRRDHVTRIGRAALIGLVSFAGKMRELPLTATSHVTATVMTAGSSLSNWYQNSSAERKHTINMTALSLAIGGLAAVIASRLTGLSHHSPNTNPVAFYGTDPNNVDIPVEYGATTEVDVPVNYGTAGGVEVDVPVEYGKAGAFEADVPVEYGATEVDIPTEYGQAGETDIPENYGTATTEADIPVEYGATTTEADVPVEYGATSGIDLSGATMSEQLFEHGGTVSAWPDEITVSKYKSSNHDGSLWGISEQLWRGSGVENPSDKQVQQLVDALYPQAGGNNGQLLEGQKLRLAPALNLLP
jgi:hypothetical protein